MIARVLTLAGLVADADSVRVIVRGRVAWSARLAGEREVVVTDHTRDVHTTVDLRRDRVTDRTPHVARRVAAAYAHWRDATCPTAPMPRWCDIRDAWIDHWRAWRYAHG